MDTISHRGVPPFDHGERLGRTVEGARAGYFHAKNWPSDVANMPKHLNDADAIHSLGGWATEGGPVTQKGDYPLANGLLVGGA